MEYKDTLNLPRTGFAMKADLVAREPQRLQQWQASGLYQRIQQRRAGADKFILHDGPPFANGDVHIGTALNKILKDMVVKYQSLRGKQAPYIPGWDCHGLPIEFKVVQELRKQGVDQTTDAATIRRACEAYAKRFIDLQRRQFQRLGVLGDWDHPYLTFTPQYEADELRLFADLVERGFVYRGKKPVYWSIPCRTALAEAEVEYKDHVSQSIYVKFPVIGRHKTYVLIWTTTPWTLPANLAIAYNSTFNYTLISVGEENYILSVGLLNQVAEKCGWDGFQIVRSLEGAHLAQITCQHPFASRTAPLFAGDAFVDNTTGTGFVHIAPGHGLEDYHLGREKGLPIYSPVDDNGCLCLTDDLPVDQQMSHDLVGLSILEKNGKSEANEGVLRVLRENGMLVFEEAYTHSYPHCWRSKTPIIFRAMNQWFIRIDQVPLSTGAAPTTPAEPRKGLGLPGTPAGKAFSASLDQITAQYLEAQLPAGEAIGDAANPTFRNQALAAIDRVQWIPEWGKNRIEAAVKSRPDWCISRQRTWGVPIPAFYDGQGNPILDARVIRATADLVEKHGSNVWFEKSAGELWTLLEPADWQGPSPAAKSTDTLDVWIDSGSSSRTVIGSRSELVRDAQNAPLKCQADLYLEGSDQHRGWFQSSLLLSLAGNGYEPFRSVMTHGFMVDADREKISKSKQGQGGYEKPQTADAYVKKYGADVVRLWVASQDFRNDIIVSDERINKVGETYRVIRNALRYQLSNLYDFDPPKHHVRPSECTALDRWILDEFIHLQQEVLEAYDRHEFHVVYQKISQFVAVELSAIYHDVVKDRLYTDGANSPRRRSTQTVLHLLVTGLCQLLSPVLAFTADEAWEFIPGRPAGESVHTEVLQEIGFARDEGERAEWANLMELRNQALPKLEEARQAKLIGKSLEACVTILAPRERLPKNPPAEESLRELLNVSQLKVQRPPSDSGELIITITRAEGQKCERCWRWETDVNTHAQHPGICGRCVEAIA